MSEQILTEEELNKLEQYRKDDITDYEEVGKLIASHRSLLSANAELSFENFKLKKFLVRLQSEFFMAGDYNNLDKLNTFMEESK